MKLSDLIAQIQSQLPKYTNSFCDVLNVVSASRSVKEITLTLDDTPVSDVLASIEGIYAGLLVTSVSEYASGQYELTTTIDHDQTYSESEQAYGALKYVKFSGSFSGTYRLIEVTANNKLVIASDTEPTGTFYLLENRGYNGRKSVTVDTENKTVKYDVDYEIDPISVSGTVLNNIRIWAIASEVDIQKLLENQTATLTKNTIFVMLGECIVSSDNTIRSDALIRKSPNDSMKIEVRQTASIYVVIPTQGDVSVRTAVDSIHTIRTYFIKSLHGALFDSGFSEGDKFCLSYSGDAGESYNASYYVHRFDFDTIFNINDEDAVQIDDSRAFRSFDIGFKLVFDDYTDEKKEISGDIE